MFRRLAAALLLRRLARDISAGVAALEQQNVLLARLADHWAPVDPRTTRVEVQADTGVSHLNADEAAMADAFIERTYAQTGHVPDEDEVLIYLADEKTVDLQQRLSTRGADLERLAKERAW